MNIKWLLTRRITLGPLCDAQGSLTVVSPVPTARGPTRSADLVEQFSFSGNAFANALLCKSSFDALVLSVRLSFRPPESPLSTTELTRRCHYIQKRRPSLTEQRLGYAIAVLVPAVSRGVSLGRPSHTAI